MTWSEMVTVLDKCDKFKIYFKLKLTEVLCGSVEELEQRGISRYVYQKDSSLFWKLPLFLKD
jgi:hypothetical protein